MLGHTSWVRCSRPPLSVGVRRQLRVTTVSYSIVKSIEQLDCGHLEMTSELLEKGAEVTSEQRGSSHTETLSGCGGKGKRGKDLRRPSTSQTEILLENFDY